MDKSIGIRINKDFLNKVKELEKEETLDRSSVMRKLVYIGYREFMKEKAYEEYLKGKITLSEAAHKSEMTIWEMAKFLVEKGYKSSYSIEDLDEEIKMI